MAQGSTIEWTEAIWNPVTGCTKVSPGCKHCYAERMATRLRPTCRFSSSNGGGRNKKATGRVLEGREWNEMPSSGRAPVSLEWRP
jgi:protein gp37